MIAPWLQIGQNQSFLAQGGEPCLSEDRVAGSKRPSPRKHDKIVASDQLPPELAGQFSEHPLDPVSGHRPAELLAHDDTNPGAGEARRAEDQIEQRALNSPADLLDSFDLNALPQEELMISRRSSHLKLLDNPLHRSHSQARSSLGTPASKHLSPVFRTHPFPKSVVSFSF